MNQGTKKRTSLRIIIAAVVLVTAIVRFAQVAFGSMGEGRGADSPDKKFSAKATSWYCKRFWGGVHNYYEFTVQSAQGQRVHRVLMDEPPQGMVGWREDGSI